VEARKSKKRPDLGGMEGFRRGDPKGNWALRKRGALRRKSERIEGIKEKEKGTGKGGHSPDLGKRAMASTIEKRIKRVKRG